MKWVVWPIALAIAAALAGLVIFLGHRSRALASVVTVALLAALAGIWVVGLQLINSGWHDIDGFADCHDHCDAWHAVGGLFFLGPPLVAFLLVLVFLEEVVRRGRGQRSSRPRSP